MPVRQVVEHRRHHATCPAGGSRHDGAARGVFLAGRQGIGVDQAPRLQRLLVARGLDIVGGRLTGQVERAGQYALVVQTAFHTLLHSLPHFLEVGPDVLALAQFDILPVRAAVLLAPVLYLSEGAYLVHFGRVKHVIGLALRQGTAAHAVHHPLIAPIGTELHAIGVVGQEYLGLPVYVDGRDGAQHLIDGYVGHVALARGSQTAVEGNVEEVGVGMALGIYLRRALWSHGMARRGAFTYLI